MKKGIGNWYSIAAVAAAIFFAFGSMRLVDEMLLRLEQKMFSESGQLSEGTPEAEFNALVDSVSNNTLTEEQISQALENWRTAKNKVTHSPEKNQLSMDEAIAAGEQWISTMSEHGILPKENFFAQAGYETYDVYGTYSIDTNIVAILSVGFQNEEELGEIEPYFSFWNLIFNYGIMSVELDINAVTGQVWHATVYSNEVFLSAEDLKEGLYQFAKMAGMTLTADAEITAEPESDAGLALHEPGSKLSAIMLYKYKQSINKVWTAKYNEKGNQTDSTDSQATGKPLQYVFLEMELVRN